MEKKMSRQTEYQARMRAEGRCVQCGEDADGKARCVKCAKKMRLLMRKRLGAKPQKAGERGRPRTL